MGFFKNRNSFMDYINKKRMRRLLEDDPVLSKAVLLNSSADELIHHIHQAYATHAPNESASSLCIEACSILSDHFLHSYEKHFRCQCAHTSIDTVSWVKLAGDRILLKALLRLLLTGCGASSAQETSAILLSNICTLAAKGTRSRLATSRRSSAPPVVRKQPSYPAGTINMSCSVPELNAVSNLLTDLAPDLSVLVTEVGVNRILSHVTTALEGMILSTAHCVGFLAKHLETWYQRSLLVPQVLLAIQSLLPPLFLQELPEDITLDDDRMKRFRTMVHDDDVRLDSLTSLFKLLATALNQPAILAHLMVSDSKADISYLSDITHIGLGNIFSAVSSWWPCHNCRPQILSLSSIHFSWDATRGNCHHIWSDQQEYIISSIESLVSTAFILLSTLDTRTDQLTRHVTFIGGCFRLAICLLHCRAYSDPAATSRCVIFLLRVLGQYFARHGPVASPQSLDWLSILYYITVRLSYRLDWCSCSEEVCWTLANAVGFFHLSVPISCVDEKVSTALFIRCCLLPSLRTEPSLEALRFLLNVYRFSSTAILPKSWYFPIDLIEKGISELVSLYRFFGPPVRHGGQFLLCVLVFTRELLNLPDIPACANLIGYIRNNCTYLNSMLSQPHQVDLSNIIQHLAYVT